MRYGLTLPNAGSNGDAHTLAELATLAEDAGWDGVFLEDYIVHHSAPDAPTYDPWLALAAIACNTTRIRIGTSVTPLTRRRPWKLARETVTLDHLSNGRVILGVGLGDLGDAGFAQVGEPTDNRQRARILDEALTVLTGLWSGEPFAFSGEHFQVDHVTLLPRPVQQPRIPIWVGGNWPHKGVMRRAARWDGFAGGKEHAPEEDWHLTAAEIREVKTCIASQRTTPAPFDIVLGGAERSPDWEHDRALIRSAAESGATWWMEYVPVGELVYIRDCIARGPLRIG
ncbi:MAG: luciferase [Ktedonobacterales bacterium]|jgi:alkanesulfonate monooxygenase SsuD/methylene tetrahydromethanopterin reductase-like flavin-dependent oxidoreductase (luciferase family)|nr:MAG: luciferase [Ktedonobacterales bacterium]